MVIPKREVCLPEGDMRQVSMENSTRMRISRLETMPADTIILLEAALQRLEGCQAREMNQACLMNSNIMILFPPKDTMRSSNSMPHHPTVIQAHLVRRASIIKNTTPHMEV